MVEINSLDNELIKKFASLNKKKYRDEYKLFIIDDIDLIRIADDKKLLEYYLYSSKLNTLKNCKNIIKTNDKVLSKLSNLNTIPNGVGICRIEEHEKYSNKIIALDSVQDPGNGGTILRSALAFDFNTMILSDDSFDKYNEKFIRASKGSFFDESIIRCDIVEKLKELKKQGYKIITADLTSDSININDYKYDDKVVIVVGNEGNGIRKEINQIKDNTIYIPIHNIESLNVGVAASIIMSKNIVK